MNCADCEAAILDEIDPGNGILVAEHVAGCVNCEAFLQVQRELDRILCGGLAAVRLPVEFETRMRERIRLDRSLARIQRIIALLEFISYPLLAGAVLAISAVLMRFSWLDPRSYLPAITVTIAAMTVKELVSGDVSD